MLQSCNRVAVIDHHRRAATYIEGADLNFHEPYASSACELVAELIAYLMEPTDLLPGEAEALMAGLMLDTKNFTMRTGGRTFEAAAMLRRAGGDTGEVRKLFQTDLNDAVAKYGIIQNAKIYRNDIAIAVSRNQVGRVTAAKAADELLNIAGIGASFVLYPEEGRVVVSGRSFSATNVQVILEALGGKREQLITYLSQLKQLGVFEQAAGILLGTFTAMEKEESKEAVCRLVRHFAGSEIPVAKTQEVGHGDEAKAVVMGRYMELAG